MSPGPNPLTRQRSPWTRHEAWSTAVADSFGIVADGWMRRVHDCVLMALVAQEPTGWHMAIFHCPNSPKSAGRYPSWDELAAARYELLPDDRDFVMHLPPPAEYVAVHDTTFHLHEHPPREAA
jgi:hypothetical protein